MSTTIETEGINELTKPGETLFAWSIFPLTMIGCVGLAIHLHNREADALVALLVPLALGYAVVIAGERLYPYVTDWNRSHDDVATDAAWWLSINTTGLALRPLAAFVAIPVGGWLSARFGAGLWPSEWPLVGQLALAFVIVEFFHYWAHRLMHETDILWRFHATHHSAPRLYWLNSARFHIVDIALLNLGFTIPLVALGADARVLSLWIVASAIHDLFQHANLSIRCGTAQLALQHGGTPPLASFPNRTRIEYQLWLEPDYLGRRFWDALPAQGSRASPGYRHRGTLGLSDELVAAAALALSLVFHQRGQCQPLRSKGGSERAGFSCAGS